MVPVSTELAAGFFLLLAAWWAHLGQRHDLRDEAGDLPLTGRARTWPILAGVGLTAVLHGNMFHAWATAGGANGMATWNEWAGIGATSVGVAVRGWAIATLGRLFTFELGLRAGHVRVQCGPYARVRHPGYAGTLLIVAGLGLYFGPTWATFLYCGVNAVFFARRIRVEERMLGRQFGAAFERYAASRYRLLPFVF